MPGRSTLNYSQQQMDDAIYAVQCGNSMHSMSKLFRIPRMTLSNKVSGKTPRDAKYGRNNYLHECELELINWIECMSRRGAHLKMTDVVNGAQNLVSNYNISTPFYNGRPGLTWFNCFKKRNPNLAIRQAARVSKVRALTIVSEETVRKWFKELKSELEKLNQFEILNGPTRVFSVNEINIQFLPNTGKVISTCDWKNIYQTSAPNTKSTLTFLGTFSAAGDIVSPCIVVPYQSLPAEFAPERWYVSKSESGMMTSEIFYEFVCNAFNEWLLKNEVKRPVILFVDGHRTHLSLDLSIFCEANGIILYLLPPYTTHMLQPADVGPFKFLKSRWHTIVDKFKKDHNYAMMETKFVAPMLDQVMKDIPRTEIMDAFRACGLCPFNPDAVDYPKTFSPLKDFKSTSSIENRSISDEYATALQVLEREIPQDYLPLMNGIKQEDDMHFQLHLLYNNIKTKVTEQHYENIPFSSRGSDDDHFSLDIKEENIFDDDSPVDDYILKPNRSFNIKSIPTSSTMNERQIHSENETSESSADSLEISNIPPGRIIIKKCNGLSKEKFRSSRNRKRKKRKTATKIKMLYKSLGDDWICYKCRSSWISEDRNEIRSRWIECDACPRKIHIQCISLRHRMNCNLKYDESDNEVEYLCENCIVAQTSDEKVCNTYVT